MPRMIASDRGDVILVDFVFADESGRKVRPALIVSARAYNDARQEIIIAAITSNVSRRLFGDQLIEDWQEAGLLRPSVVTGVVRTIRRPMILRRLGALAASDLRAVDHTLRRALGL